MTREDEEAEGRWAASLGSGTACPVCLKLIPGDTDVVEAHVDACLAHEARVQEERERERLEMEEDVDIDGDVRLRVMDGVSFRGA